MLTSVKGELMLARMAKNLTQLAGFRIHYHELSWAQGAELLRLRINNVLTEPDTVKWRSKPPQFYELARDFIRLACSP